MYKFLFSFILLAGCATTPPKPKPDLCATVYDPHLCILTIDSTTFAAYGANRCLALKQLEKTLEKHNHNPLVVQLAECGRVFK
jgi:hypothetical protein